MKFFLITGDRDALTGMQLAGIEGVYTDDAEQAEAELKKAAEDESIGIILVTDRIAKQCAETVKDIKINRVTPLLVEIPNSDQNERPENSIMKIVHDAIGV